MLTAALIAFILGYGGKKRKMKKNGKKSGDKNEFYPVNESQRTSFSGTKDYRNGSLWAYRKLGEAYASQGETGIAVSDVSANTCRRFAYDLSLTENGKGKKLTDKSRSYYAGLADGFLAAYDDLCSGKYDFHK